MAELSPAFSSMIRSLIRSIGDDPDREGLRGTPARVARSYDELFAGYRQDPAELFTVFESGTYDQMVLLKDIEFVSTCEHHLLPVLGRASVAYLPDQKVVGLSKLSRLVEIYSRRLQIQERLTEQVTSTLMEYLQPKGAGCVIVAQHLCMICRGVRKQNSVMVTSSLKGEFLKPDVKSEFLSIVHG